MSDFNFKNFETINSGLMSALKNSVPTNNLESLSNNLKMLFSNLEKATEYTNVIGFMRSTGQGEKAESVEFELNETLEKFSKQKDIVLNFFGTQKFPNLALKKLGKAGFSLNEKEKATLNGKKLEALFKKNLNRPTLESAENKQKVRVMQEEFKANYRKKLESVAKFLPLQTANLFIDLMMQYEKIANFNISDQEKLAKSREIDEDLAKIGCVNLKYLVINERNCMISNMLTANFEGEIKQSVQDAYSSFYISPMENENYRKASIIAETLKINYLNYKGLADEYGKNSLEEINVATKTNTVERYVFTPSPAEIGLIDEDTINIFNEINTSTNAIFDTVFPPAITDETNKTLVTPKPNTNLSQNLMDNAMSILNNIENLKDISADQKSKLEQDVINDISSNLNEQLSSLTNNADRASLTFKDNKLTQTAVHEEDNVLVTKSVTVDKEKPTVYEAEQKTTKVSNLNLVNENGTTTELLTSTDKIDKTTFEYFDDATVFTNHPSKNVITSKNPETKEETIVILDDNFIPISISGDEKIAKLLHDDYLKKLSPDDLEIYQQALYEKEMAEREVKKKEKAKTEKQKQELTTSANGTEKQNSNSPKANNIDNKVPTAEEIYKERNRREEEAEKEDVMVMMPTKNKN